MQVDELIRELIASGTMDEETQADLERMRAEHVAGTLHPDDEAYIRAFHARITNAPMPEPMEEAGELRLDGHTIAEWRDRALRAEAELAEMRVQQAGDSSKT